MINISTQVFGDNIKLFLSNSDYKIYSIILSMSVCLNWQFFYRVQLKKLRLTLDDIDTLDTACQAATNRLSSLRSSKVFSPDELLPSNQPSQQQTDDEEHLLVDHIEEIQKEKEHLTSTLPTLTHATSDDDMLSTDGDGSLDDLTCLGKLINQY